MEVAAVCMRRVAAWTRAALLLLLAVCAGCEGPVATEVLVLIDADPALAGMLVRLQVDIYEGRNLDDAKQPIFINLGNGPGQHRLPVSFSIAARDQDDRREFRVVVTGFDAAQQARTEQQVITRFHPNAAGRLDLFLFTGCSDLCRFNGQLGPQTCNRFGTCENVPVIADLPTATSDDLGGYTSVVQGGQSDSGTFVVDPDAGAASDALVPGSASDAAARPDGGTSVVGSEAGGPTPDAGGSAPDAGAAPADAASDASVQPTDANASPSDAASDAARDADADTGVDLDAEAGVIYASNPIIPTPSMTCPSLQSGTITVLGLTVKITAGVVGSKKGSLLLYWHGTGSSPDEVNSQVPAAARSEITDGGGMIVSAVSTTNTGTATGGGIWYPEDFAAVDLIVACAVRDANIDPRRIYATGCSSGALQASALAFQRASYFAAVTSNSGGLTDAGQGVLQPGAPRMTPILSMFGGATDEVIINFATASMTFCTQAKARGGFAIECDHGLGHCRAPAALQAAAWQFMKDHPYGVTPKPYGVLPASFPNTCAIK